MTTTIEKFTQSLDKKIEKLRHSLNVSILKRTIEVSSSEYYYYTDLIAQRKNVKRIINTPKEKWEEDGEVFISFDELSPILKESGLRTREKVEIIFLMFEKNIATKFIEKDISCFNEPGLANYPFKYTTFEEAAELIHTNSYRRLYEKKDLTPLEKLKLEEIKKAVEDNPLDLSNIIEQHKLIKKHYFDKYPNFNKEDINIIIDVLKYFGLAQYLLEEVSGYFNSLLEKSNKLSKENMPTNIDTKIISQKDIQQPKISSKEYNALNRELKAYYDLNNNIAIRPLSLEEQIICVYLLQKMEISKERINGILHKINKKSSKNPTQIYIQLYNKFAYYKDNEEIAKILKELEFYYPYMLIENNNEIRENDDYELAKMLFEDALNKILELIPKTYDYEYEKAKELSLNKKI